jgi:hypothetical protein
MTGPAILAVTLGISPPDIVCTCAHGADHGTCPMHRTRPDSSKCRLQGTQNDLGTVVVSVLGPVALPATSVAASLDRTSRDPIGYLSPLPSDWIVPPEPPPPRS